MGSQLSVEVHVNTSWFVSVRQRPWKSTPFTTCRTVGVGWAGGGVGRAASGPTPTGLKRACGVAAPCPFGPPLTPGPLRALRQASEGRPLACPALRPPHPTTSRTATAATSNRVVRTHRTGAAHGMVTARDRARTITVPDTERPRTMPESGGDHSPVRRCSRAWSDAPAAPSSVRNDARPDVCQDGEDTRNTSYTRRFVDRSGALTLPGTGQVGGCWPS